MSADFSFRYDGAPETSTKVPEVASEHFTSLFNCDGALLRGEALWKGFIREYREGRETFQDWLTGQTEDDWDEFMRQQSDAPQTAGFSGMSWGPSAPFAPNDAREWATAWIEVLEPLTGEELKVLFPLDIDPQTRESRFDKPATLAALSELVRQADWAAQHGANLTVEMTLR